MQVASICRWPLCQAYFLVRGLTPKGATTQQRASSWTIPVHGKMVVCSSPFRVGIPKLCVQLSPWLATTAGALTQQAKNTWDAASHTAHLLSFWEDAVTSSLFFWAVLNYNWLFLFLNKIWKVKLEQVEEKGFVAPSSLSWVFTDMACRLCGSPRWRTGSEVFLCPVQAEVEFTFSKDTIQPTWDF